MAEKDDKKSEDVAKSTQLLEKLLINQVLSEAKETKLALDSGVGVIFLISIVVNLLLWLAKTFWYQYSPTIVWFSTMILLLNAMLTLIFGRKGIVFAQALSITALVVQTLILVLLLRTGTFGG